MDVVALEAFFDCFMILSPRLMSSFRASERELEGETSWIKEGRHSYSVPFPGKHRTSARQPFSSGSNPIPEGHLVGFF